MPLFFAATLNRKLESAYNFDGIIQLPVHPNVVAKYMAWRTAPNRLKRNALVRQQVRRWLDDLWKPYGTFANAAFQDARKSFSLALIRENENMSIYNNLIQDDIDTITLFFNFVDAGRDGYITPDEISEAMAVDLTGDNIITDAEKIKAGQEWMANTFNAQDFDHDQKISLSELLQYNNDNKNK